MRLHTAKQSDVLMVAAALQVSAMPRMHILCHLHTDFDDFCKHLLFCSEVQQTCCTWSLCEGLCCTQQVWAALHSGDMIGIVCLQLIWSTVVELAASDWQPPWGKGNKGHQQNVQAAITGEALQAGHIYPSADSISLMLIQRLAFRLVTDLLAIAACKLLRV